MAGTMGLAGGNKGLLQIQASLDLNHLRTLYTNGGRSEEQLRIRNTVSFLLEGSYAISDEWSIQLLGSYLYQDRLVTTVFGTESFTRNTGLGDLMALLHYQWSSPSGQIFARIGAGPVIPIGEIDALSEDGLILSPDLQPGGGSLDFLTWSQIGFSPNPESPDQLVIRSSYRHTGTSQRLNGLQQYQFGHEFQGWFGYRGWIPIKSQQVFPELSIRYRNQTPDVVNEVPFDNTGGHWLFIRPAIQWQWGPQASLNVYGELPVWEQLIGTQLTTTYRLGIGVLWSIATRKESVTIPGLH